MAFSALSGDTRISSNTSQEPSAHCVISSQRLTTLNSSPLSSRSFARKAAERPARKIAAITVPRRMDWFSVQSRFSSAGHGRAGWSHRRQAEIISSGSRLSEGRYLRPANRLARCFRQKVHRRRRAIYPWAKRNKDFPGNALEFPELRNQRQEKFGLVFLR